MEAVVVKENPGSLLPPVFPDGRVWRQGQRLRHLDHLLVDGGGLVRDVEQHLVDKLVQGPTEGHVQPVGNSDWNRSENLI